MKRAIRQQLLCGALIIGAGLPTLSLADTTTDVTDQSMTCQQLMDKAKPMMDRMADPSTKQLAEKEVDAAKMDMGKGKNTLCKRHMKKAMDLLGAPPNGSG